MGAYGRLLHCLAKLLAFGFVLGAAAGTFAQPLAAKDDWGRELVFKQAPSRIISLSAHLTELAAEVGLDSFLVGVDLHSVADKSLPRLSAYPQVSVEAVMQLKPDLVLVWGAGLKKITVDRLEGLGVRVFVSEPKKLSDIVTTIERLAALTNRSAAVAKRLAQLNTTMDLIRTETKKQLSLSTSSTAVPVFVQVWQQPLMTLGLKTFLGDALLYCGVRAVLAPNTESAGPVNPEAVLNANIKAVVSSDIDQAKAYWKQRANRQSATWNFIALPDSILSRPSAKLIDALPVLCKRVSESG
jgi:iron complex transport system substrate-binding protein